MLRRGRLFTRPKGESRGCSILLLTVSPESQTHPAPLLSRIVQMLTKRAQAAQSSPKPTPWNPPPSSCTAHPS